MTGCADGTEDSSLPAVLAELWGGNNQFAFCVFWGIYFPKLLLGDVASCSIEHCARLVY